MPVCVLAVFLGCKLFLRVKRDRAHANACYDLAVQAYKKVREFRSPPSDLVTMRKSIDSISEAVAKKDINLLAAYANLIDEQPPILIGLAVFMIQFMNIGDATTSVSPESLTSEQVSVYHEVSSAAGAIDGQKPEKLLDNGPNRVGFYAMEHMDQYPLILSIIRDRGINNLDTIKTVMHEMEASGSSALASGTL